MIQVWNIKKLKERLSSEKLNSSSRFAYLFIWLVLFGILGALTGDSSNKSEIVYVLTLYTVFGAGMYLAYQFNGGKEGSDFSDRFMSIAFVETVRFIPLFILFGFIAAMGNEVLLGIDVYDGTKEVPYTWIDLALGAIVSVWYAWRVGVHVRDVHNAKETGL